MFRKTSIAVTKIIQFNIDIWIFKLPATTVILNSGLLPSPFVYQTFNWKESSYYA